MIGIDWYFPKLAVVSAKRGIEGLKIDQSFHGAILRSYQTEKSKRITELPLYVVQAPKCPPL